MDKLVVLLPLLPFCSALIIGVGLLFGWLRKDKREGLSELLLLSALTLAACIGFVLMLEDWLGNTVGHYLIGTWLNSETVNVTLNFINAGLNLQVTVAAAVFLLVIARFSITQLRQEMGYHRFLCLFTMFAAALFLMLLSSNMLITFIGWQITSVCAYLMIAYAYDRPVAAQNATRFFLCHRIGDAGFLLGIGLSYSWLGTTDWLDFMAMVEDLGMNETTTLTMCFAIAAFSRSAQLPFTPWLVRSMEGPASSSAAFFGAVFVHSGIFLIIALRAVFEQSVLTMNLLVVMGVLTALYGMIVGLTQTDIKSSLVYAIIGQLGLMCIECGLGFWQWALLHMLVHAALRSYQLLFCSDLSIGMRQHPVPPLFPTLAKIRWAYVASLQRFWLDPLTDWMLVNPVLRLGKDLSYFDDHIVNAIMGVPAPTMNALATLAQLEEQQIGAQLDNESDSFAKGSGLAGKLAEVTASLLHWIEERLVIRGIHEDAIRYGHSVGLIANRIEQLLLRPRYLSLFVFITLLAVF